MADGPTSRWSRPGRMGGGMTSRGEIAAMLKVEADRDLLFGTLAVQLGFVTRDGLDGALGDWSADPSRPLSEVLVRRGTLTGDEAELLAVLADRHLSRHG